LARFATILLLSVELPHFRLPSQDISSRRQPTAGLLSLPGDPRDRHSIRLDWLLLKSADDLNDL
jgi:hypothetical protein